MVVIICSHPSGNYHVSDWLALLVAVFMRERPLTSGKFGTWPGNAASPHALAIHKFTIEDCQVLWRTVISPHFSLSLSLLLTVHVLIGQTVD